MSDKKSEKQAESSVVVKPKGKCAEFAIKIAGPMAYLKRKDNDKNNLA